MKVKGSAGVKAEAAREDSDTADADEAPEIAAAAAEPKEAKETKAEPREKPAALPRPLRDLERDTGLALKEYLESIGPQGSFSVSISREEPKTCRVNGRDYSTAGHLATVREFADEEYISRQFGGGTYNLRISKKNDRGSFQYAAHRTITVAGEPKIEHLPVNAPQAPPAANPVETTLTRELLGVVKETIDAKRTPEGIPPGVQMLLEQIREDKRDMLAQMKRRDDEIAQLREAVTAAQSRQPPTDPFRDRMIENAMTGESARLQGLVAKHESELRALKDQHAHDLRLLEERHDRAMAREADTHAREVTSLRQSFEREIAAINSAHNVATTASATTASVTKTTLDAEVRRLERQVTELQTELKDLRAVKDKSLIEQIKEIKAVKEVIDGEDGGGGDTAQKIVEAIPAALSGIGEMINAVKSQGAAAAQQPAQARQAPAVAARPRVVRDATGQRFVQAPGSTQMIPVKPKPKVITTDHGQQIEVPQIDAPKMTLIISMLEAAFGRNEDPKIVAQSAKSSVPTDILAWIRLNHTDHMSGVDLFMSKVAKLPGTSPLSSQLGREWLREVGAALLAE